MHLSTAKYKMVSLFALGDAVAFNAMGAIGGTSVESPLVFCVRFDLVVDRPTERTHVGTQTTSFPQINCNYLSSPKLIYRQSDKRHTESNFKLCPPAMNCGCGQLTGH